MKSLYFFIVLVVGSIEFLIAQTPSIKELPFSELEAMNLTVSQRKELDKFFEEEQLSSKSSNDDWKKEPDIYLTLFRGYLLEVKSELETKQKDAMNSKYKKTEVDSLVKIISKLKIRVREIKKLMSKLYGFKNRKYNRLFPSWKNGTENSIFEGLYDKNQNEDLYYLNNTSYQFNNGSVIRSELLSAYLKGLRISLGTVITTQNVNEGSGQQPPEQQLENTDETEAFKRLVSGGSTYLDFELPVTLAQNESWTFYWNLNSRLNLNIEGFSNDLENKLFNGSTGTRFYGSVSSENKEFIFYSTVSAGFYYGEEQFYHSLAIPTKGFFFGQIQLGVTIAQNLKLTFDINSFSSEESLRSGRVVVGAQLLTDFFKKEN